MKFPAFRLIDGLTILVGMGLWWPAGVATAFPGVPLDPAAFWVAIGGGMAAWLLLWNSPERMAVVLAAWLPFSDLSSGLEVTPAGQMLPLLACVGLVLRAFLDGFRLKGLAQWLLMATAGWFLLCALLSGRPGHSLLSALSWVLPFAGFLFFLQSPRLAENGKRERIFGQIVLASGLSGAVLLAYVFAWSPFPGKAAIRPFFLDANIFSAYLSLVLPGLVGWAGKTRRGSMGRYLSLGLAVLLFLGILALRSRGAWIGLGGGLLLAVFFWLDNWLQRGLLLVGGLLMGIVVAGIMRQYLDERPALPGEVNYVLSSGDLQADFSNRERVMRWEVAWRMALDRPVLGHGPGNFAPDFKHYLRTNAEVRQISYWFGWTGGAHSVWLTALAETGFLGLLLLLASIVCLFWDEFRRPSTRFRLLLSFSLFAWMVHGIFNDLLMVDVLAAWLGIWAGMRGADA